MAAAKKQDQTEKVVEIPAINLRSRLVVIHGMTPLITNRISDRALAGLAGSGIPKNKETTRDPEAEFQEAIYRDANGSSAFPAAGIKKALVHAGGRFADEKMTVLRGIVNVMGDFVKIEGPEPTMQRDVARNKTGALVLVYRPRFFPWSMEVPVVWNASMLSEAELLNLFQIAGFSVGIGCWRPETNGTYGQFAIQEMK